MATTRAQPALPPVSLTGKQATLKPNGLGSLSKFASFSIWQYSLSLPTKWAPHSTLLSPVLANSSFIAQNGLSHPQASIPITLTPCSISHSVDSLVMPQPASKYSGLPHSLSAPVCIITMSQGLIL